MINIVLSLPAVRNVNGDELSEYDDDGNTNESYWRKNNLEIYQF